MGDYKYIKSNFSDNFNVRTQRLVCADIDTLCNRIFNDQMFLDYNIKSNQTFDNGCKIILQNKKNNLAIILNIIQNGDFHCILDFYMYEYKLSTKRIRILKEFIKIEYFLLEGISSFNTCDIDESWNKNINLVKTIDSDIRTA